MTSCNSVFIVRPAENVEFPVNQFDLGKNFPRTEYAGKHRILLTVHRIICTCAPLSFPPATITSANDFVFKASGKTLGRFCIYWPCLLVFPPAPRFQSIGKAKWLSFTVRPRWFPILVSSSSHFFPLPFPAKENDDIHIFCIPVYSLFHLEIWSNATIFPPRFDRKQWL